MSEQDQPKGPELPKEIDGVPIREPGSVYLPKQLAPVEGDTPVETKILIKVKSPKDDLERCVHAAVELGGTSYFGLHKGDPVFKTEMDPQKFFKYLLDSGVWLKGLFLIETYANGFQNVKVLVPTWIRCEGCRKVVAFRDAFSRQDQPTCDECLQKAMGL
jgi:hypothetical protein